MENEKRLIDANDAIERAKKSDKIVGSSIWETGEVVEFLEDCPIVDAAEVVHGRWEKRKAIVFDDEMVGYRCSNCNTTWDAETNYCPNCGTKMDGDVDG